MLRLPAVQLASMIEIDNATAGTVSIAISCKSDNKKKDFTEVVIEKTLRTTKVNTVALGTLPCRYLKVTFGPSKIGSAVKVNSLRLIGCDILTEADEETKVEEVLNSHVSYQILNL